MLNLPIGQTRSWGVSGNLGISDGKPTPSNGPPFWHGGAARSPPQTGYLGLAYYLFSGDFKDVA
jgi:hypothetical protein